jgi:hypothetical protein
MQDIIIESCDAGIIMVGGVSKTLCPALNE